MTREPIVIVNAVISVIVAIIMALVSGGALQITEEQKTQLISIVTAIGVLVGTFVGRSLVTPAADPRNAQGQSLTVNRN